MIILEMKKTSKKTRRKYTKRPKIRRKYTKRTKKIKKTRSRVKYKKRPRSKKIKKVKRVLYQLKLGGGLWNDTLGYGSHAHDSAINLSKKIHVGRFPCTGKGDTPCIYKGAGEGAGTKCYWCGEGIGKGEDIYVVPGITGSYIYHNKNCSKKSGEKQDDANIRVAQAGDFIDKKLSGGMGGITPHLFMRTSEEMDGALHQEPYNEGDIVTVVTDEGAHESVEMKNISIVTTDEKNLKMTTTNISFENYTRPKFPHELGRSLNIILKNGNVKSIDIDSINSIKSK